jgi:hypothetical protein
MSALGENGPLQCEAVQVPEEIALAFRRVRTDTEAVRCTRNETSREEFLDDECFAGTRIFRVITERE